MHLTSFSVCTLLHLKLVDRSCWLKCCFCLSFWDSLNFVWFIASQQDTQEDKCFTWCILQFIYFYILNYLNVLLLLNKLLNASNVYIYKLFNSLNDVTAIQNTPHQTIEWKVGLCRTNVWYIYWIMSLTALQLV